LTVSGTVTVPTPTNSTDAVTKAYADSIAAGINWHEACKYATAGVLPNTPTYSNGTNGVGATLTAGTTVRLNVDGANATTGNRVLVKNQATATQNGIYTVQVQGSVSAAWVLVRSTDADNSITGQVKAGDAVFVIDGSTNSNQGFILTSEGTGTNNAHILGTDSLTYTQFTGTSTLLAGAGLTKTGNTIDAVGTADRITVNADSLDIASTYVGQSTITTLGTITTGTWGSSATPIALASGGTNATNAAGARTNLGLVIGTNVQAYDAELAAIAGLTSAADALPYFTGSGTASTTTLTTFGRSLIDDVDASAARTTLGLVIGTNVQAYDADLTTLAGVTAAADNLPYFTGTSSASTTTLTTFGRSLIDDADASTARTTLGLVIGTNVQAYDADLAAIAALAGTSGLLKKTAADTWSLDTTTYMTTATPGTLTGSLTLRAGTATASTAPLYLTSGTNLTTAAAGAMEFDGTNLYFSPSTTRKTIAFTDSAITSSTFIGTTSVALNRSSGALTLAGITLTTPVLGVATATSINGLTITSSTGILTVTNLKTLSVSNTLTLAGTDSTTMTFPTTSATIARTDAANTFTGIQTMTSPAITTSLTTGSASFDLINTTATTVNFAGAATVLTIGASNATINLGSGSTGATVNIKGNLVIDGTTTTINSTTLTIDDKNIVLGADNTLDTAADGGGITLKGATDKTLNWVDATDAWTSSEHLNIASGKAYYINGTSVLNGTTLGTGITASSLTSFGATPTVASPILTLSTTTSITDGRIAWDSTADKIIVGDGVTAREFASSTLITNARVASYILVLGDKDKLVEMGVSSGNTLTVPPNGDVAFSIGTQITVIQTGSGQTTLTPGVGVTINGTPGLKTRAQWSAVTLIKRATNTWVATGDLSA
jgi:hypothetical protein